jgi:hypothetical protein
MHGTGTPRRRCASSIFLMTSSFEPVLRFASVAVAADIGAVEVQPNALAKFRDHLLSQARLCAGVRLFYCLDDGSY